MNLHVICFVGRTSSDNLDKFPAISDMFDDAIDDCHCWCTPCRGYRSSLASCLPWQTTPHTRVIFYIQCLVKTRISKWDSLIILLLKLWFVFVSFSMDIMTRSTFWNITLNGFILWLSQIGFSQNNMQRITSLPTLESARRFFNIYFSFSCYSQCNDTNFRPSKQNCVAFRSIIIFTVLIIATMLIIYFIGAIMYANYQNCDPVLTRTIDNHDTLILHFVYTITGHINGIRGIFIACLFCASLCCIASAMHTMSGIIYFDIIRSHALFTHNNARAIYAMRVIIILIGAYCALSSMLVQRFYEAFKALNVIANMTMGAKVGVFTVGIFYPYVNIQVGVLHFDIHSYTLCRLVVWTLNSHKLPQMYRVLFLLLLLLLFTQINI